jgi:hypothetical protein
MIPALIMGAASLLGGAYAARQARQAGETQAAAAQEAAQAQLQASREAQDVQRQMYERGLQFQQAGLQTQLGLLSPQIQVGQQALSAISSGLGLGTPSAQPVSLAAFGAPGAARGAAPTGMPSFGATQAQMDTAARGMPTGQFRQTFAPSDIYTDPSYQFRVDEGLRALRAKQSAYGTLLTGQGMKDITGYAQGLASTEYQSAYDRFMKNQETLYNRLANLAGIGTQGATNAITGATTAASTAAQNLGTNLSSTMATGAQRGSEYLTSAAAAQAAGQVGGAQAIAGGINRGLEGWMTLQTLGAQRDLSEAIRRSRGTADITATQPFGMNTENLPGYNFPTPRF